MNDAILREGFVNPGGLVAEFGHESGDGSTAFDKLDGLPFCYQLILFRQLFPPAGQLFCHFLRAWGAGDVAFGHGALEVEDAEASRSKVGFTL